MRCHSRHKIQHPSLFPPFCCSYDTETRGPHHTRLISHHTSQLFMSFSTSLCSACGAPGVVDSNCPACYKANHVAVLKAQLKAFQESDSAELPYPLGAYVHSSGGASTAGSAAVISSFGMQGASTTGVPSAVAPASFLQGLLLGTTPIVCSDPSETRNVGTNLVRAWGLSNPDAQPPAHVGSVVSVCVASPIAFLPSNFFDDGCHMTTLLQSHSMLSHTFTTESLPLQLPLFERTKKMVKQCFSTLLKENMQHCQLETAKNCLESTGYKPTTLLLSPNNLDTELKRSSIEGWDLFYYQVWCAHTSTWAATNKNPNLTVLTSLCVKAMGLVVGGGPALAPGASRPKIVKDSFRRHATRVYHDETKRLKDQLGGAAAVSNVVVC
jgi:hypothetical protein